MGCQPARFSPINRAGITQALRTGRELASIRKLESGNYRAEIARQGVRKSKVFPTKTAAKEWAARQEYLILNAEDEPQSSMTFGDMLDKYAREVSVHKRGERWETVRIEKLRKDKIAGTKLSDLTAADFADWRDRRRKEVQPGSVIREMQLMSSALNVARKEWGLIKENPLSDVKRPPCPAGARQAAHSGRNGAAGPCGRG